MVQDVGIIAAGVFEGVGEDGKAVEGAIVVDGLTQGGGVRCSPGGVDSDGMKGVAEDVAQQGVRPPLSDSIRIQAWAEEKTASFLYCQQILP
jgi:hypothetical protein